MTYTEAVPVARDKEAALPLLLCGVLGTSSSADIHAHCPSNGRHILPINALNDHRLASNVL